jgi:hypothetical protein
LDMEQHRVWYRCPVCRSFWIETERYLARVPDEQAIERFGKEILNE